MKSLYLHSPMYKELRQSLNDHAALTDAHNIVEESHPDADQATKEKLIAAHAIGLRIERMLEEEHEIASDNGKTLSADDIAWLVAAERKRLEPWRKLKISPQRQSRSSSPAK